MKISLTEIEERLKENRREEKKYIGWISTYIPEEIIIAAGFFPYRIMGTTSPISLANTYLIGNLCSFVQGCLESALKEEYDFLSGVIFANDTDAMKRLYDAWIRLIKTPFVHVIDIPKVSNDSSLQKYKEEIEDTISEIEGFFKIKIDAEKLRNAISLCNKTRTILSGLNGSRKNNTPLISACDFLRLCKFSMIYDKAEFNNLAAQFAGELKSGPKNNTTPKPKRILLMGSFQDQASFLDMVEETGCQVVCEDTCTRMRYFGGLTEENIDPIDALAKRYLNKPPSARMADFAKRADYIKGLIDEFKIDAVIYYILKFDDPYLFEFPDMKNFIRSLGLPVLRIESEHNACASGQVKTRIQAFAETLIK